MGVTDFIGGWWRGQWLRRLFFLKFLVGFSKQIAWSDFDWFFQIIFYYYKQKTCENIFNNFLFKMWYFYYFHLFIEIILKIVI